MSNKYYITQGKELIHSYCFNVEFKINGEVVSIGFSKISSIQNNVEYETIIEGSGEVHIVPKYVSQPQTISFSKGIAGKQYLKDLKVGSFIEEIVITVGRKNYDEYSRRYIIKNCVITKWNTSDIDAMQTQLFLETFEVSYTQKLEVSSYKNTY